MSKLKLFAGFRRCGWHAVLLACALFSSLTGRARAQTNIVERTLFVNFLTVPVGIAPGWDGGYWFMERAFDSIGRIDFTSNSVFQTNVINPYLPIQPFDCVRGQFPYVWFTQQGANRIGRINTTNFFNTNLFNPANTNKLFVDAVLPTPGSEPLRITIGPDSNIWFIEFSSSKIASITPDMPTNSDGTLKLAYESLPLGPTGASLTASNSQLYGITAGPDGNIWFTEFSWGVIGRITVFGTNTILHGSNLVTTPGQVVIMAKLANTNNQPCSIVTGPDGALWFTEYATNLIGRITTNGTISEFTIPGNPLYSLWGPYGIIAGPDGKLWFSEHNGSAIGSVTTNGIFTIFPTPSADSNPNFLATGATNVVTGESDTNIWFCEDIGGFTGQFYQAIGHIVLSEAMSLDAPTTASFTSGTTFSGLLGTFQNSNPNNTVTVFWGDGTSNTVVIHSPTANASATNTTVVRQNSTIETNFVIITNIAPIATNNLTGLVTNGTYQVLVSKTYPVSSNFLMTLTVTDASNDVAVANIALLDPPQTNHPAFFAGEDALSNNWYYLQFPDGNLFGYYNYNYFPYLYHQDLGFEYFLDANDGHAGAYLYDFTSQHWWYTNPSNFPYIYDFSLNAWLYYYPDTQNPGRYTTNPRYFYNFSTNQKITQ